MGLKLSERYPLRHGPDVVWQHLGDVEFVASCFPGATLDEAESDGNCRGRIAMKLGPTRVTFSGTVRIELDPPARTAVLHAKGDDAKRSRASATATVRVEPEPAGGASTLHVDAEVEVIGPLGQFARSGGHELTRVLLTDFAAAVDERLDLAAGPGPAVETEGVAAPIRPGRLIVRAARATVRGWLERLRDLLRSGRRSGSGRRS